MPENVYETDRYLAEYLLFHFGRGEDVLPWSFGPREALHFPKRCARLCRKFIEKSSLDRALDLGCAVGGAAFELTRFCREVVGIDFSKRFIQAAQSLKEKKILQTFRMEEGTLAAALRIKVPPGTKSNRVHFETGDACDLRRDLGDFNLVLAANLIDRLPHPRKFLDRLPSLVRPGGLFVMTSPYTWMEDFTPKRNWLGGVKQGIGYRGQGVGGGGSRGVRTSHVLQQILRSHFSLRERKDMPFLIREHARKYQWCVAEAMVWTRKGL